MGQEAGHPAVRRRVVAELVEHAQGQGVGRIGGELGECDRLARPIEKQQVESAAAPIRREIDHPTLNLVSQSILDHFDPVVECRGADRSTPIDVATGNQPRVMCRQPAAQALGSESRPLDRTMKPDSPGYGSPIPREQNASPAGERRSIAGTTGGQVNYLGVRGNQVIPTHARYHATFPVRSCPNAFHWLHDTVSPHMKGSAMPPTT